MFWALFSVLGCLCEQDRGFQSADVLVACVGREEASRWQNARQLWKGLGTENTLGRDVGGDRDGALSGETWDGPWEDAAGGGGRGAEGDMTARRGWSLQGAGRRMFLAEVRTNAKTTVGSSRPVSRTEEKARPWDVGLGSHQAGQ